MLTESDISRFWRKVDVRGQDECWPWTAYIAANGYGKLSITSKLTTAHRVSVLISGREIPEGMWVDHLCRNRQCVNPGHLEVVTPGENTARGEIAIVNRRRANAITHCPKGHEYTPENTYLSRSNKRHCKACSKIRHDIRRKRPEVKARAIEQQRIRRAKASPHKSKLGAFYFTAKIRDVR